MRMILHMHMEITLFLDIIQAIAIGNLQVNFGSAMCLTDNYSKSNKYAIIELTLST